MALLEMLHAPQYQDYHGSNREDNPGDQEQGEKAKFTGASWPITREKIRPEEEYRPNYS